MAGAAPVLIYDRIDANRRNTLLLMLAFVLLVGGLIGFISVALGLPLGALPVAFAVAVAFVLFSYFSSSRMALIISQARPVTEAQEPELHRIVENLCIGAGLPIPKVYVIDDTAPNAFATGRDPKHAAVAVTTGLLEKLDKQELEGVIAHELSHIGNYDTRLMATVVVLLGLVALLADLFFRWTWYGAGRRPGNRDRGGGGAYLVILVLAIVFAILAPLAARLIAFAISRQREYMADASGALLTRYPEGLASALAKIAADKEPLEAANKATAHLYIVNPLFEHRSWLNNLFSTHPPLQERIALLRAM